MTPEELRSSVFACMYCDGRGLPFNRNHSDKFYRFPPIGAPAAANLLFIGINPRVSHSNRILHNSIVEDVVEFRRLSENRVGNADYIGNPGLESHYRLHVSVVKALFPGSPFASAASLTELHFCATSNSQGLPYATSLCADQFLPDVLEIVSPQVVFAVGAHVERTLRVLFKTGPTEMLSAKWSQTGNAPVFTLPLPTNVAQRRPDLTRRCRTRKKYLATTVFVKHGVLRKARRAS